MILRISFVNIVFISTMIPFAKIRIKGCNSVAKMPVGLNDQVRGKLHGDDFPHSNEVTDRAGQHEEMENGMHISLFV